jgi:hypothetical protein
VAEFCSLCSPFENQFDIDLVYIALHLERGHSESFICEGCFVRAIYKDENGNIYLGKLEQKEIKLHPVKIEDLIS